MFDKDVWEAIKLKRKNGCKTVECKVVDENIKLRKKNNQLNSELETYKKIAEKLAEKLEETGIMQKSTPIDKSCIYSPRAVVTATKQDIIDWARNEVENE